MAKILITIKDHVVKFRESYIHIPLAFLFLYGAILIYSKWVGKKPVDDIGVLIGYSTNFIQLILAAVFTGLIKGNLLVDLTTEETKTLPAWRVILDSTETLVIFFVSLWIIRN